jgi:hypothetical protein
MTDRSHPRDFKRTPMSRRDVLRVGGAMIPAGIILPTWLTASAQTVSTTFDYYISATGSDSNPGTLAAPWAITSLRTVSPNFSKINGAGKQVGIMPGTYNVSSLMPSDDAVSGALQLPGGTSSTPNRFASCDASGNYSPRTATITALSSAGVYGGVAGYPNVGPVISHSGEYPSKYTVGNIVIDGLIITGFSYKGLRIGGNSSGDGPSGITGVVVQNCEFTGGKHNASDATDNTTALWLDYTVGALATNNYFYDNTGFASGDMGHLNAIICWGCQGSIIQFNTCINAGNIYGKEINNQGNTIAYNYVDTSMYTAVGSASGVQDFVGGGSPGTLTQTTSIHHNIMLSSAWGIENATLSNSYGWQTPVNIYNNTIILNKNGVGPYPAAWVTSVKSRNVQFYNNIYSGAADGSGYKAYRLNAGGPSIWDYNLFLATGMSWALAPDSNLAAEQGTYSSLAAVQSAVASLGGITTFDAHSIANNSPGFVGTSGGALAQAYQLQSSSPARNSGTTNGTTGGKPCDMGAWGNGATQVGCSFAAGATSGGAPVPMAPTLTVS